MRLLCQFCAFAVFELFLHLHCCISNCWFTVTNKRFAYNHDNKNRINNTVSTDENKCIYMRCFGLLWLIAVLFFVSKCFPLFVCLFDCMFSFFLPPQIILLIIHKQHIIAAQPAIEQQIITIKIPRAKPAEEAKKTDNNTTDRKKTEITIG